MASPRSAPKPLDLELTIVSAKHLKNVNWRNGILKPYVVFWLDPNLKSATKPDESGSIKPVWNERFTFPIPFPPREVSLTLQIFHSKPSETPKPLVGSVLFPLKDLIDYPHESETRNRCLDLVRPSGRPHGKIILKLVLRERSLPPIPPSLDYQPPPPPSSYYSSWVAPPVPYGTPALPTPSPESSHYCVPNYGDPYPSYYSGGYYNHPPPSSSPRPHLDHFSTHSQPSAPVDFSSGSSCSDQKLKGYDAGLTVGTMTGALGGLALGERPKSEEDRVRERAGSGYEGGFR